MRTRFSMRRRRSTPTSVERPSDADHWPKSSGARLVPPGVDCDLDVVCRLDASVLRDALAERLEGLPVGARREQRLRLRVPVEIENVGHDANVSRYRRKKDVSGSVARSVRWAQR